MIPVIAGGHALDAVIANSERMLTYVEHRMVPLPNDERHPVVAWEENLHTLQPIEMLERFKCHCMEIQKYDNWEAHGVFFDQGGCRNSYNQRKPDKREKTNRGAETERNDNRDLAWRASVRVPLESEQYLSKLERARRQLEKQRRQCFLENASNAVQWGLRKGLISFSRPKIRSEEKLKWSQEWQRVVDAAFTTALRRHREVFGFGACCKGGRTGRIL